MGAEWSGYERRNGLGRMVVLEETPTYRSPLSGRIAVRDLPRAKDDMSRQLAAPAAKLSAL